MELRKNLAAVIRAYMQMKHLSLTEFADELGISRNSLHNYRKGEGNPTLLTVEHIAERLEISAVALAAGLTEQDQPEIVLLLLKTIQSIAELPAENRQRMAELFLEIVKLWNKT